ncbi:MAG: 3-hydroxyacyl-ACP dehydratase FabZ [Xanthomonadales bacterium]|nr:3-hydroxyacyl-ACP dehydratase FabZ [Xanthomonadales bacterium]
MNSEQTPVADIERIFKLLPHRYPFLLIDRVLEIEHGKRVRALKNVTYNEPCFTGHFPEHPVMPGVLVLEALAQACGALALLSAEKEPERRGMFYLVKIDKARFSRLVVPGDQLILEAVQKRLLRGMGLYDCIASVDGKEVACAEILCAGRPG